MGLKEVHWPSCGTLNSFCNAAFKEKFENKWPLDEKDSQVCTYNWWPDGHESSVSL